jgi:hypothetical protein
MRIVRLLVPLLVVSLAAPAGAVAGPAASPASPATSASTADRPPVPTLVDIRAAHHPGFDRIVFEFAGGLPDTHRVRYVRRIIADASGRPVRVAGRARLRVVFSPADNHDASGPTTRRRTTYDLPNIMTAVRAGDFEAVTTYGIGLAKRTPFEVFTLRGPARVVIDVKAAFPTTRKRIFFFDRDAFVDNDEPFFRPVLRSVPSRRPFVGVLDRLFAGTLPGEHAAGLRLLRSRASGFADLTIDNRIARVRLTGGCSSGGSTVSVAGEIMPTLRQFPRVDWVKIYGPGGHTGDPTGPSDSIPACLEP